ncbi:serine/threonine-protein kinase CTR1-like isoform X1 [Primulina tabacum]|uniref:serine/threonine-protein kinase CTR1-like isoform X1 n=1 Tax=Primulina tabacum TaxID=48773 RepID=UPI003F592AD8
MGMPGRRSNYTLLSQIPDESLYQPPISAAGGGVMVQQPSYYEPQSGDNNKQKMDRTAFDWYPIDQRMIQAQPPQNRIGTTVFPSSFGLQRQSSGSSFGESSISGDYYVPSLSNPEVTSGSLNDGGGEFWVKAVELSGGGGGESSSSKSWAQQTEESYQLQLVLALRLSSEATCADDPNFLDPTPDESTSRASSFSASAEAISHRFWVNGCLSYFDKVPDGFYSIRGMDPYVWAVCSDLQESGRMPSLESLKSIDFDSVSSVEVISVDRRGDPSLRELQNRIHNMSSSSITPKEVVDHISKLVCNHMGGATSNGEDDLISIWKESSDDLKDCLGSIVLPIASLSVGLCRHRALLFKVLADIIGLPCRIAKGCKYCTREDASSCLVRFGLDREYLIDLVEKPGCLCEPDSLLNGPSSISISSPLRFPRFRQVEPTIDFRSLAKLYFSDFQSLNLVFDDSLPVSIFWTAGTVVDGDNGDSKYPKHLDRSHTDRNSSSPSTSNLDLPPFPTNSWIKVRDKELLLSKPSDAHNLVSSMDTVKDSVPFQNIGLLGNRDGLPFTGLMNARISKSKEAGFVEAQVFPTKSISDFPFDTEDLNIPWSDLIIKETIGAGSFGIVYRAEWNDSEVAVKILMEQDLHAERFKEFLREVAIMKRLRHPNIVLFMGAVTEPPNLSIVTEYLSRGSLYKLLHKPGAREALDEKRRLSMAFDVAKGMNYLHKRNPPIVHRDLKSPNLLVDRKYTVKVCDFGLSRLKANTFLSSKSAAGTPEWMAPEVLRDEPSNEKSDVYSFGVILWELATLQQPWGHLNPAQVVAAVAFKSKRLEIPHDTNPQVAAIIEACWTNEPWKRPSFSNIMESLRTLIKCPATTQPSRAEMSLLS